MSCLCVRLRSWFTVCVSSDASDGYTGQVLGLAVAPSRANAFTRTRRRLGALVSDVCAALDSLANARAGHPLAWRGGRSIKGLHQRYDDNVVGAVRARFCSLGAAPADIQKEGALRALLKSCSTLSLDARCSAEPYDEDRVNIVKGKTPVIDLLSVLPVSPLKDCFLSPFVSIVRDDVEVDNEFAR